MHTTVTNVKVVAWKQARLILHVCHAYCVYPASSVSRFVVYIMLIERGGGASRPSEFRLHP